MSETWTTIHDNAYMAMFECIDSFDAPMWVGKDIERCIDEAVKENKIRSWYNFFEYSGIQERAVPAGIHNEFAADKIKNAHEDMATMHAKYLNECTPNAMMRESKLDALGWANELYEDGPRSDWWDAYFMCLLSSYAFRYLKQAHGVDPIVSVDEPYSDEPEAPEKKDTHGFVYIIQAQGTTRYKIGRSKNPDRRISNIATSSPFPITTITTKESPNCHALEKTLHRRFRKQRCSREWFDLTGEQLETATQLLAS